MTTLSETLKTQIFDLYLGGKPISDGHNTQRFALFHDETQVYAVNVVELPLHEHQASVMIMARVVHDFVMIDADTTDNPLYKALIVQGIAREKIILAYIGETLAASEIERSKPPLAELGEIIKAEFLDLYFGGQQIGGGFNLTTFALFNDETHVYASIVIDEPIRKHSAQVIVMARIVDDCVIIDEDTTDRPLYQTLMRCGILREKIILTYAGEKLPETMIESE